MDRLSHSSDTDSHATRLRDIWISRLFYCTLLYCLMALAFLGVGTVEKRKPFIHQALLSGTNIIVVYIHSLMILFINRRLGNWIETSSSLAVVFYSWSITGFYIYLSITQLHHEPKSYDRDLRFFIGAVVGLVDVVLLLILGRTWKHSVSGFKAQYLKDVVPSNILAVRLHVLLEAFHNLAYVFASTVLYLQLTSFQHVVALAILVFSSVGLLVSGFSFQEMLGVVTSGKEDMLAESLSGGPVSDDLEQFGKKMNFRSLHHRSSSADRHSPSWSAA